MSRNLSSTQHQERQQHERISGYYVFQSKIYDMTRWSFLFGRLGILKHIPFGREDHFRLAEIGCGTGFNLNHLAKNFPKAEFIGADVSKEMMDLTRKKLANYPNKQSLHQQAYEANSTILSPAPDIILFSYALTMINPQWKELLHKAYEDLAVGGKIMVVDFHDSSLALFKNHMSNHHVRMDSHILPELENLFSTVYQSVRRAYGGIWKYFLFVGEKSG
ncbi:MAG: class I SAM-dependent methyltransferase [Bacteroidota bacterium]